MYTFTVLSLYLTTSQFNQTEIISINVSMKCKNCPSGKLTTLQFSQTGITSTKVEIKHKEIANSHVHSPGTKPHHITVPQTTCGSLRNMV